MYSSTLTRAYGARLATLLGTASFLTMGNAIDAHAQAEVAQAEEIPETVLITGSLIRGTAAVGVPVTNLSPMDFAVSGALTTADRSPDATRGPARRDRPPSPGGWLAHPVRPAVPWPRAPRRRSTDRRAKRARAQPRHQEQGASGDGRRGARSPPCHRRAWRGLPSRACRPRPPRW